MPHHTPKPLVPLALVGTVGALLISDFFRLPHDGHYGGMRGSILLLGTISSTIVGLVLGAPWLVRSTWRRAVAALLLAPAVGAAIGTATWLVTPTGLHGAQYISIEYLLLSGATQGAGSGLGFVPPLLAIVLASHRVGRARFGSLIDASDRRAPWLALASFTILALPIVVESNRSGYWRLFSLDVSFALAELASLVVVGALVQDIAALRRVRVHMKNFAAMEVRDESLSDEEAAFTDLGIGEEELTRVERVGVGYRGTAKLTAIVKGDFQIALNALTRAVVRSAIATAISVGVLSLCLSTQTGR